MRRKLTLVLLLISLLTLSVVGCKSLTVYLTTPINGSTVTTENIEIRGYVSDSKATVWVNDTIVAVTKVGGIKGFVNYNILAKGHFSTNIDLNEGENIIIIVAAKGEEGNWKEAVGSTVTVTYNPK
ncbi:hypothetical protein ACFLW4_03455 [Chloroflexota bacterium]